MSHSWTKPLVASGLLATVLALQPVLAAPRDIVLALDNSGSMRKNDPEFLTPVAVKAFINELRGDVHLAILIFDQRVRLAVPLTRLDAHTRGRFLSSLRQVDFKGLLTDSPAALERAIYELKMNGRSDAQKSIVFMTDGIVDTGNKARDLDKTHWMEHGLAEEAAHAGIRIFGIAFTEQADFQLIQSLAERTGGDYFRAIRASDIQGVFEHINHELDMPAAPPPPPPAVAPQPTTSTSPMPAVKPPPAMPPGPPAGTPAGTAGTITGGVTPTVSPPPASAAPAQGTAGQAATSAAVTPAPGTLASTGSPPMAPPAQGSAGVPPSVGAPAALPTTTGASAGAATAGTPPAPFEPPPEPPPAPAEPPAPASAAAPPAPAGPPATATATSNGTAAAAPAGGAGAEAAATAPAPAAGHGTLLGLPWPWVAAGGGGGLAALLAATFLVLRARPGRRSTPQPPAPRAYLNDLSGCTDKPSYELTDKLTIVGRLQGADPEKTSYVVIDEATIGRRHAMIEYKDHSFWVIDQSSLNGTFVNNRRINQETRLKHGDRVRFHKREFEFVMLDMFETDRTMVSETMFTGLLGDAAPEMEDDEATQMRDYHPRNPAASAGDR